MSQKNLLIETLKKALKTHGLRYEDVANELGLSTGTIKRLFSEQDFSLDRLEQICAMMDIELSDLFQLIKKAQSHTESLTIEQEQELVSDIRLLMTAHFLINNWQVRDILAVYDIAPLEMTRYLARLDRMKLIDLHAGDRVKLRISRSFSWIRNGPIERFFKANVQSEFLDADFNGPGEQHVFISGMLSRQSNQALQARISRLTQLFDDLHKEDEALDVSEKFGTSMVVAMRPWDSKLFEKYRRAGTYKAF